MKPVNMAKELGQAIANSKEHVRLLEAQKLYKADREAVELVKRFRKKQQALSLSNGNSYITDTSQLRKELSSLFIEIENNGIIKELNNALDDFLALKQMVYDNIEDSIKLDEEILALNNRCGCKKDCGGCKK